MRGVTLHGVLIAAALGAAGEAARAQEGGGDAAGQAGGDRPAASEAMEEARALFERGTLLMQNENWTVARVELARSFELNPSRSALFNLAMCEKALHEYVASLRRFEEWQERFGAAATEGERRSVAAAIDGLRQLLGTLAIATTPAGAAIRVDGEEVGTTPLAEPLVVAAGPHTVEAALEGYATARADVLVAPLETVGVPLSLEPAAAGTPPAEVTPDLAAGDREPGAGLPSAWFWATAGTAAAMGIGGAVAGGITLDKEGDLDALAGRCRGGEQAACDEGLAMLGDRDDAQLAANVLLFGAGALAATALVLAFFTDFDFGDEAPPVQVTAGPAGLDASGSPSGAALGVSVAF